MRLDRFLAETTDLTRSLAKKALHRGEVSINGIVVKQPATQVSDEDRIEWAGQTLELIGLRYVMLNKPSDVECSARRGLYPRAVDLIDLPKTERLQTVGRLDVDTTGLVLLTDDGQWSHRVTSPRRRCAKVYRAVLAEPLVGAALDEAARRFEEGILLEGEEKPTLPAQLAMLGPCEAELTLYEGRYHQVKRMFAALGNRVTALERISIGPLTLGSLRPGEWRELSEAEVAAFV
ncbi:pseudouridine synthase [Billgrantia tianxiuensis]|jgi:16S rRNA pseudouridine516 synthase|uniref:Pseudouridine synthase n=1 Tax=Billgrantia tianxiuensis TaxID=2497861 RepID=A0A6I6STC3_9GAMM|nr:MULTISPECIES: pseudouridine synthase [Halomonas]MCE8031777.1 pseudouridine synthase [Halomonas sp. MCCC 1A11057]QHC50113.1 pseudouridine synthase [Halomonas tianxiuensis]